MSADRWMTRIRKGDVLCFPGDVFRVVRDVSHYQKYGKPFVSITLAIRRCSWTGRPFTTYTDNYLKQLGVRPTGARMALRHPLDKALEYEINGRKITHWDGSTSTAPVLPPDSRMDCCDVRGIA